MKVKIIVSLCCFTLLWGLAFSQSSENPGNRITVYIFLHENCLISQFYTLPLKELHAAYANEKTRFVGIFPNRSSQPAGIQKFKEKYEIPFSLKTDHDKQLTKQFKATVTPEVVVFDGAQNQVLYQGRIDNTYARVGKKRRVTTTSELKDVLKAIADGLPVPISTTDAIGCFINLNETVK